MAKRTKFDWEIYDENGEFLDVLTMTRDEMREYHHQFPNQTYKEIDAADERGIDSWDNISKKGKKRVFRVRLSD